VNFGIVGCGLIGRKRAQALGQHRLIACVDADIRRAEALAFDFPGTLAGNEPSLVLEHPQIEAVIVCTTHDSLSDVALSVIEAGKHVLVEKPAGRSAAEVRRLVEAAQQYGVIGKVGFNHRFHPSFQRAREIMATGGVGDLMYIRARYGHGGRPGYEKEWRADPRLSGGGELLDQGSHLIDLARWFAGDVVEVTGHVATYFWPMQVEDNAFMCLKFERGTMAWMHASWTEWKNLFSFEIFGRTGKLQIDGLGGSYGTERLTYYRMLPEMGPPETTSWEFPSADASWGSELGSFAESVESSSEPCGSLRDGLANLEVVEALYRGSGRDYHA
jgi:predicted dehydrogenase